MFILPFDSVQRKVVVFGHYAETAVFFISRLKDSAGNYPFVEMVQTVKENGEGYVNYYWQWKDMPEKIVPKMSYVKGFMPWGWIIGTGIYMDDISKEIAAQAARDMAELIEGTVKKLEKDQVWFPGPTRLLPMLSSGRCLIHFPAVADTKNDNFLTGNFVHHPVIPNPDLPIAFESFSQR